MKHMDAWFHEINYFQQSRMLKDFRQSEPIKEKERWWDWTDSNPLVITDGNVFCQKVLNERGMMVWICASQKKLHGINDGHGQLGDAECDYLMRNGTSQLGFQSC